MAYSTYDPKKHGALCDQCPLNGQGYVAPEKDVMTPMGRFTETPITIVGECPSSVEVSQGRMFAGPAGTELDKALRMGGIKRGNCHVTNVVLCNPPGKDLKTFLQKLSKYNRTKAPNEPTIASPIDCCRPRLEAEIEDHRHFITLGKTANHAVTGNPSSIMSVRGALVELEETERTPARKVMPTVPPGLILHQMKYAHVFRNDIAKAGRWFRGEAKYEPPEIIWHPTADVLREFLFRPKTAYAFDLETDGINNLKTKIRCIGIGNEKEVALVGLLGKDGYTKFYSREEEAKVIQVLRDYFSDDSIVKVAHNGINFDAVVLYNQLGVRPRNIVDTMLAHKSVESELPHGLGYVVSLYAEAPAWKCYDGETEVLTPNGWVRFDQLEKNVQVAQWDRGNISFVLPRAYVNQEYKGQIWKLESQAVDLMVTPDHKMVYRDGNQLHTCMVQDLPTDGEIPHVNELLIETWSPLNEIKRSQIELEGRVYCVSVPSGFILVRRNGKCTVSGNTDREGNKLAAGSESDEQLHEYCLYEGTPVVTEDGQQNIETLVRNRYTGKVLSLNKKSGELEWKAVTNWHYTLDPNTQWYQITVEGQRERDRGLICTHDHKVIGPSGEVEAKDLKPGDLIYDSEPQFTEDELSAILGTLMGDTIISVSPVFRKDVHKARTAALSGGHVTESGFTAVKCKELKILTPREERPARKIEINGRKGEGKPFTAFYSDNFRQIADLSPLVVDQNGNRRLYVETLEKMGPRGWAWWFMDDGCVQKYGQAEQNNGSRGGRLTRDETLVISTQRYPRADLELVKTWFTEKFGSTSLGADNVLRLNTVAARTFATAIAPYLPVEARYKLPHCRDISFDVPYVPVKSQTNKPSLRRILNVAPYTPVYEGKHAKKMLKYIPQRRYCIDVEDNHNFFTPFGLVHNCAKDVQLTSLIQPKLLDSVQLRGQSDVWKLDQRIQEICAEMHMTGMYVDQKLRLETEIKLLKRRQDLLNGIRERLENDKFNPNSVDQLRDLLFTKWKLTPPLEEEERFTSTGDPSTSDLILRALLSEEMPENYRDVIKRIRYYRKVVKVLGTYVTKLRPSNVALEDDLGWDDEDEDWIDRETRKKYGLEKTGIVDPLTGRMYPGYSAGVAVTGRLSSSKPINAQNFPKGMRKIITAAPGNILIGADMDQLELRIAAARWNVELYLRAFLEGKDPHSMTAYAVFGDQFCKAAGIDPAVFASNGRLIGTDFDESGKFKGTGESKKLRDLSKAVQYASQYMAKVETVHKLIQKTEVENKDGTTDLPYARLPLRQVREMHSNWLKGAPEFEQGWEKEINTYRRQGYLAEPITGRRRDFLDGESPNEIVNFNVQSTAAGLMNVSLVRLAEEIPFEKWGPGTGIINQCHDAIVIECPADGCSYSIDENGKKRWDIPKDSIPYKTARLLEECLRAEHPSLPGVVFTASSDIEMSWDKV